MQDREYMSLLRYFEAIHDSIRLVRIIILPFTRFRYLQLPSNPMQDSAASKQA